MIKTVIRPLAMMCALWTFTAGMCLAAEQDSGEAVALDIAGILALADHLKISPKAITGSQDNQTVGLDYEYDRQVGGPTSIGSMELDLSLNSAGLIVAEKENAPNRLLAHSVRMTLVDIFSVKGKAADYRPELNKIYSQYYGQWYRLWEDANPVAGQKPHFPDLTSDQRDAGRKALFAKARTAMAPFGKLTANEQDGTWPLLNDLLARDVTQKTSLFFSFDLDLGAETDQDFSDTQWVGSCQIRGKVMATWFDYPFSLIRGYRTPKSWLNRNGGPHFWAGIGYVDAGNNDYRKAITEEHTTFARWHAGAYYRTELLGRDEERNVAVILLWRYYSELDAPAAIKAADLDCTSYFKARFLFPHNLFIEYSDGKLPLDVAGASAVGVGFQYNF